RGEVAAREHQRLLECALSRDAAGACQVLETHIQSCVEHALGGDVSAWFPPLRTSRPAPRAPAGTLNTRRRAVAGSKTRKGRKEIAATRGE
ncbi:MAG TPA: hypothetical protein VKA80_14035, partial [Beijerinckiaceae bacterium]|nr:hypothetical protein [Beijerinckiaceae bacterium]